MFFVPLSLSTVLYAVGSGESKLLADRFRLTVYVSLGFGVVSNLTLLFLAKPLLSIFGSSYASEATGTLRILALFAPIAGAIFLICTIWMLVAMVIAVRQALDYRTTARAIAVCALGFPIYALILAVSLLLLGPWPL